MPLLAEADVNNKLLLHQPIILESQDCIDFLEDLVS